MHWETPTGRRIVCFYYAPLSLMDSSLFKKYYFIDLVRIILKVFKAKLST